MIAPPLVRCVAALLVALSALIVPLSGDDLDARGPRIAFVDLASAPNSGGEGGDGAFVTIYGTGFGATRAASTVTIGGGEVAAYRAWGEPYLWYQRIRVQLGARNRTGDLVVTTAAGASAPLPFAVRAGVIRFVATGGDDAADGSVAHPWRSPAKARGLPPGGICYLRAGTWPSVDDYSAAFNIFPEDSGTATAPKALVAYPGESPVIGGPGVDRGIQALGHDADPSAADAWWIFAGLAVRGRSAAFNLAGHSMAHLRIVGCDLRMFGNGNGLGLEGDAQDIAIVGNDAHDNGDGSAKAYSLYLDGYGRQDGIEIGWNDLHDNLLGKAIQIYGHAVGDSISGVRIHHNRMYRNAMNAMVIGGSDGSVDVVKDVVVADNLIYDNANAHPDWAYDAIQIQNYGNVGTASAVGDLTFARNTFYHDGSPHVVSSGDVARGHEFLITGPLHRVTLIDNIIAADPGGAGYLSGDALAVVTGSGNCWSGFGPGPAQTGGNLDADPRFVDAAHRDLRLAAGSPAIGVASDVGGTIDIVATARPSGAGGDLGALQTVLAGGGGPANQPPSVALVSPADGTAYAAPATVVIAATASDGDGAIAKVEFSDGTALIGTATAAPYQIAWSATAVGSHTLSATAYDDRGATATSSVTVTVTATTSGGTATLWDDSTTPVHPDVADGAAVEVGVKIRSDVAGSITGLRFYKGAGNTGTHIGHLWTRTGTLLGSVAFTGETTSGWQRATFATPIAIAANTTYIASYHTDVGHYAGDNGFFAGHGVDRAPLHALADGVDGGDGVYAYGASTFPNQSWRSTNYWVDASFATKAAGVVDGGVYKLVAKHSGKLLDVEGISLLDGANVHQWTDWNGPNQQWRIAVAADGSCQLTSIHSGKVLEVAGGALGDGGNVDQWTNLNGPNQRWRLDDVGDGWYRVTNVASGKVLDVSGISLDDGANIHQWTWWGGDNQRWELVPVTPTGGG